MDTPEYIIRTYEAVLMPIEVNKGKHAIKVCIWVVIALIIIGSLIFQDNLFAEFSWPIKLLLIVLVIVFGFYSGEKDYVPSPMELQFFEDKLVLYLPKRYYTSRITRKQINTMKYADISKCVYNAKSRRIYIYGNGQSIWYNYKKDGSLPSNPTEERSFTRGMIYFNTRLATEIDFIKEIEGHSPIQVIIENG